jgi:plastocyanin
MLVLFVAVSAATTPAGAATYTVYAGEQSRRGAPEYATQNRFMPAVLNVHVGDRVSWRAPVGVHSTSFIGRRSPAGFSFVTRDPGGALYEGFTDATGQPLFFNGLRKFIFNLGGIGEPIGDPVVDDLAVHHRLVGKDVGAPSVTYRFPKAGTFTYVCTIHPGMKGKVVVRPASASVASPNEVLAAAAQTQRAGWGIARSLVRQQPPTATIWTGVEREGVENFVILPDTLTVKAGTTVQILGRASADPHNIGLGPEPYLRSFLRASELFPEGPDDPNQITPIHIYGSDPEPLTYDGANHGNGFLSTQMLDRSRLTPSRSASAITFTKPGEYTVYCTVHFPDMKAKVVVTE